MLNKIKTYANTIGGRTTILVSSFLLILLLFCSYVYVQSNMLKNDFYVYKNRWHPLQISFFSSASALTIIQTGLLEGLYTGQVDSSFIEIPNPQDIGFINLNFMNHFDSLQVDFDYKTPILDFKKSLYEAYDIKLKVYNRINYLNSIDKNLIKTDSLLNKVYYNEMKNIVNSYWGSFFGKLLTPLGEGAEGAAKNIKTKLYNLVLTIVIFSVLIALLYIYLWKFFVQSLKKAMQKPVDVLEKLAEGELQVIKDNSNNELTAVIDASNKLTKNLIKATDFSIAIGKGNFDFHYEPLGEKDVLGNALILMRNELKVYAEKEKEINWSNTGYAKFSEILRSSDQNIEELSTILLKNLVSYLQANQGGIFIYNSQTDTLKMTACYAYNRKKYLEKELGKNEGLVGQCFYESNTVYVTDIPKNYIEITSGLGMTTPSALLIVPIKTHETTLGVIEMASFYAFKPYEIAFVERVCESIAAVITSVSKNEWNKKLLKETTLASENLRLHDEEMRQNLEELNATQEDVKRKEMLYTNEIKALQNRIKELESRLEMAQIA